MSESTVNTPHVGKIAGELKLRAAQVHATAALLAEGATVPFIARYRKEATGALDEGAVPAVRDRLAQLAELDARREAIVKSLDERKLLTDELRAKVDAAETMAALEDVYQPFRPKRRTRAMIAREKGLEPLADLIQRQDPAVDPQHEAARFVTPDGATIADELRVPDVAAALHGARDVIAERVSDDADARAKVRQLFLTRGVIRSEVLAGKEQEGAKYKDY